MECFEPYNCFWSIIIVSPAYSTGWFSNVIQKWFAFVSSYKRIWSFDCWFAQIEIKKLFLIHNLPRNIFLVYSKSIKIFCRPFNQTSWYPHIGYLSSVGNLQRELQELRTSSPDLRDVGRDFGFSLCAAPLSDSCPKISERGDRRSKDWSKDWSCSQSRN